MLVRVDVQPEGLLSSTTTAAGGNAPAAGRDRIICGVRLHYCGRVRVWKCFAGVGGGRSVDAVLCVDDAVDGVCRWLCFRRIRFPTSFSQSDFMSVSLRLSFV